MVIGAYAKRCFNKLWRLQFAVSCPRCASTHEKPALASSGSPNLCSQDGGLVVEWLVGGPRRGRRDRGARPIGQCTLAYLGRESGPRNPARVVGSR